MQTSFFTQLRWGGGYEVYTADCSQFLKNGNLSSHKQTRTWIVARERTGEFLKEKVFEMGLMQNIFLTVKIRKALLSLSYGVSSLAVKIG